MVEEVNLPDQKTYTREELARRWNCDISEVNAYIRTGQLKVALPRAARKEIESYYFYKCSHIEPLSDSVRPPIDDDSYERLLEIIEDGEPLEKYVRVAGEKIIRREYLYLPPEEEKDAFIERANSKEIRYFYDLEGNALIPVAEDDGWPICFAYVEKHHFDSLIVPLEEVKRFEHENKIGEKSPSIVQRQEEKTEQKQEDSDNPSETTDDVGLAPPPVTDPYLTKKEVAKLIGFSISSIDKWVKVGNFPEPVKFGEKNVRWRTSVVVSWMEEKEKEDAKKKAEDESSSIPPPRENADKVPKTI